MTRDSTSGWNPARGRLDVPVVGDLTYGFTSTLSSSIDRMLSACSDVRTLRLDFSALGFCDSTGLAELLMIHRLAAERGVSVVLANRSAQLDRLLDLTGTRDYLTGSDHGGIGKVLE